MSEEGGLFKLFLCMGSSELVNFCASYTKLGTLTHLTNVIMVLREELTWGAHCRALHLICTGASLQALKELKDALFTSFKA